MDPSYSFPVGTPNLYQHQSSPITSPENADLSPIAAAHHERTRSLSQEYADVKDDAPLIDRKKNSKKSSEWDDKDHRKELPIIQGENAPTTPPHHPEIWGSRLHYSRRPRGSSGGEHSHSQEEKNRSLLNRTKSIGTLIRNQVAANKPKHDPYKNYRLTIIEPKDHSHTLYKTPDELIKLLEHQNRAFSRFEMIIVANQESKLKRIVVPASVPDEPNRLNALIHQILSSAYALGYSETPKNDRQVKDQVNLLFKLGSLQGQSLGIIPSQFYHVVADHIPAYPLLLRVFSYFHGTTHARNEIIPFLFTKVNRTHIEEEVLRDGKTRHFIRTDAEAAATAFIKVQEIGKANINRKEHLKVHLHILQKGPHDTIVSNDFEIGTMDIFYSLPVKSNKAPRSCIDIYPCHMNRSPISLFRDSKHKDTEIEKIYLKVRGDLKKAFRHVSITKKEIELYDGIVLRTEKKRGAELAEERKTFSEDNETGEVVSSPTQTRKREKPLQQPQLTESVNILQTAPQGFLEEKASRSPPLNRTLNLSTTSDLIANSQKTLPKRDSSDPHDPYLHLRMTVKETEESRNPFVSRSPDYFLEVCARVGKAKTQAGMFFYDQLYLENGDKQILIDPSIYDQSNKNLKDLLRDLLSHIYQMGYVDLPPSPDELEHQLELFFSFDKCSFGLATSAPLDRIKTYSALIPAYPLLMRLAPTASVFHYARTTALPAFFVSNKNEIINSVLKTGHPNYYVLTRVDGNKFATIQIDGKENGTVSQNMKYKIEIVVCEKQQSETETSVMIKETPLNIGTLDIIYTFFPLSEEEPLLSSADIYPRNLKLAEKDLLTGTELEGTDIERVFIQARKDLLKSFRKPISNGTHYLEENFILSVESST